MDNTVGTRRPPGRDSKSLALKKIIVQKNVENNQLQITDCKYYSKKSAKRMKRKKTEIEKKTFVQQTMQGFLSK